MTMPDQQQDVTAEIRRLVTASKLPTRQETARIEAKAPDIAPFEEQVHSLLNDSIEKIAQGWIDQLKALKEKSRCTGEPGTLRRSPRPKTIS